MPEKFNFSIVEKKFVKEVWATIFFNKSPNDRKGR